MINFSPISFIASPEYVSVGYFLPNLKSSSNFLKVRCNCQSNSFDLRNWFSWNEDIPSLTIYLTSSLFCRRLKSWCNLPYRENKNKEGKTPWALCTEEHRDLMKDGEKWMRETVAQSMLVVFSAAFTVPGGHSQQTDTPISLMVFGVSDGVALFTSSTSILMFLSILTSRYSEQDFLQSLPSRLMFGLTTLFVSITAMMITFTITSFIACRRGLAWIPILIALFATVPASVFASLQYPLLADVINSTYGSRLLFKPREHRFYQWNPGFIIWIYITN